MLQTELQALSRAVAEAPVRRPKKSFVSANQKKSNAAETHGNTFCIENILRKSINICSIGIEKSVPDLCEMSMCEPCELLEMLWHGAHQKGTVLFLWFLCALCYDATRWVCMDQTRCGSEAPKAAGNCLVPHGNPRAKITNVLNYPNYPRIPPLPPLYHCITKGWGHAARLNQTEPHTIDAEFQLWGQILAGTVRGCTWPETHLPCRCFVHQKVAKSLSKSC